ncbi:hypothetical protein MOSE0_D01420 [Monosporozyma servazzii]
MLYTSGSLLNVCKINLRAGTLFKASSTFAGPSVARIFPRKAVLSLSNAGYHSINTQRSSDLQGSWNGYYRQQEQQRNVKFGLYGLGLGLGSLMSYQYLNQPIYNDVAMVHNTGQGVGLEMVDSANRLETQEEAHAKRKVIYKQMCLGSLVGIGSAIIMAKVSGLLIYLTVISLLTFEWLRSRGIIDVKGSQLIQFGTTQSKSLLKRVKVEEMNMFKLSFLSTLLLTYANCN